MKRLVGVNCGTHKFDWYDITLAPMPEEGRAACAFLLSNAVVKEALAKAPAAGPARSRRDTASAPGGDRRAGLVS